MAAQAIKRRTGSGIASSLPGWWYTDRRCLQLERSSKFY
jgi:hypothetical protein